MKYRSLVVYFIIIAFLSASFILSMKVLGRSGNYLASFYMLGPAISAIITRLFFYEKKFKDANLKVGKIKIYIKYWAVALGVSLLSFIMFTLFGSIRWDFSGQVFLNQLAQQFALAGQSITNLPIGFTPQKMLIVYFIGGLTIFNILPGLITGFGEEFGWRGFMFPQLYRINPWIAFLVGGVIWYAWHIPLVLVFPQAQNLPLGQALLNALVLAIGSLGTHTFLAYVYIKSENIFVVSIAHATLDNVARSFAYFAVLQNQFTANVGLTISMLLVVAVLYFSKELKIFGKNFDKNRL